MTERPLWTEEEIEAALVESTERSGVELVCTDPVALAKAAAIVRNVRREGAA